MRSHPTRVRGLKLSNRRKGASKTSVAPYAGAWIEISADNVAATVLVSHPTRVRGLKLKIDVADGVLDRSHPTRVRGLKCLLIARIDANKTVAPYAGAWIEIIRQ